MPHNGNKYLSNTCKQNNLINFKAGMMKWWRTTAIHKGLLKIKTYSVNKSVLRGQGSNPDRIK